jgi:hypothetical protein
MCKKNPLHHPCSLASLTHSYFEFSSFFFLSYIFSSEKRKHQNLATTKKENIKISNQSINQSIN